MESRAARPNLPRGPEHLRWRTFSSKNWFGAESGQLVNCQILSCHSVPLPRGLCGCGHGTVLATLVQAEHAYALQAEQRAEEVGTAFRWYAMRAPNLIWRDEQSVGRWHVKGARDTSGRTKGHRWPVVARPAQERGGWGCSNRRAERPPAPGVPFGSPTRWLPQESRRRVPAGVQAFQ